MGLFKKIKNALAKTRDNFQRKMDTLFSKGEIDDEFYEELEDIMISSDVGVKTTMEISGELAKRVHKEKIRTADDARALLKDIITAHKFKVRVAAAKKFAKSDFKVLLNLGELVFEALTHFCG